MNITTSLANGCLQSFSTFAYQGPRNIIDDDILPPSPWQVEAVYPAHPYKDYDPYTHNLNVSISRSMNGQQEIWFTGTAYGYAKSKTVITIYYPELQEWEIIPAEIGETGLLVGNFLPELFVTSDGSVWGRTEWEPILGRPMLESVHVLSRFNERTRRFELAEGVPEIPLVTGEQYFGWPEMIVDNNDIFWIFAENDGIYRYDPTIQITEKKAELPDTEVTDLALAADGSIYFKKYQWEGESAFRLPQNTLFQFFPETGEITSLLVPSSEWPVFAGLLVDHEDQLWLGSIGYRDKEGGWHLLHPNPGEFFSHPGEYMWAPAYLMLESSNGIFWYSRYLDTGGRAEGTAWYNPETGEGCLVTTFAANILEDDNQQLWMAADGNVYKYPLNP